MENQPPKHNARRKNPQPVKSMVGEASTKPPTKNPLTKKPSAAPQTEAEATLLSQNVTPTQPQCDQRAVECIHDEEVVETWGLRKKQGGEQGSEAGDGEEKAQREERDDDTVGDVSEGEGNAEDDEGDNEGEGREAEDGVDRRDIAGSDAKIDEGNVSEAENEENKEKIEGEIPEEVAVVEKEEEIVDEKDGDDVETEKEVDMEVDEPEVAEGLKDIVVLEVGPESEDTPADERTARRNTWRSKKLEEMRTIMRARKLKLVDSDGEEETREDVPEVQETPVET